MIEIAADRHIRLTNEGGAGAEYTTLTIAGSQFRYEMESGDQVSERFPPAEIEELRKTLRGTGWREYQYEQWHVAVGASGVMTLTHLDYEEYSLILKSDSVERFARLLNRNDDDPEGR